MYKSNASWTKIPDSSDEHDSFEMANAICMRLREDYGNKACPIRGYCIKAWVTDTNGKIVSVIDYNSRNRVFLHKSEEAVSTCMTFLDSYYEEDIDDVRYWMLDSKESFHCEVLEDHVITCDNRIPKTRFELKDVELEFSPIEIDMEDKIKILQSECSKVGLDNIGKVLYDGFAEKIAKGFGLEPHDVQFVEDMWEIRKERLGK